MVVKLYREYPNDCLEGFVHDMASLLTSKRLRLLEWFFEQNESRVSLLQFIQMMLVILQPYIPPVGTITSGRSSILLDVLACGMSCFKLPSDVLMPVAYPMDGNPSIIITVCPSYSASAPQLARHGAVTRLRSCGWCTC